MYSTYAHEPALIDGMGHTRYAVGDNVHFSLLGEALSSVWSNAKLDKQNGRFPPRGRIMRMRVFRRVKWPTAAGISRIYNGEGALALQLSIFSEKTARNF